MNLYACNNFYNIKNKLELLQQFSVLANINFDLWPPFPLVKHMGATLASVQ